MKLIVIFTFSLVIFLFQISAVEAGLGRRLRRIGRKIDPTRPIRQIIKHATPQSSEHVEDSNDKFLMSNPTTSHRVEEFKAHSNEDMTAGLANAGISLSLSDMVKGLTLRAFQTEHNEVIFIVPMSGSASLSLARVSTQRNKEANEVNVRVALVTSRVDVNANREVNMRRVVKHFGNRSERKWVDVQERGVTDQETSTIYSVLLESIRSYSESSDVLKLKDDWYAQHSTYEGEVLFNSP
jgi:hypothetical protein